MKVQFKRCWHGNAEFDPGVSAGVVVRGDALRNTHHPFFWWLGLLKWVWHGTSSTAVLPQRGEEEGDEK